MCFMTNSAIINLWHDVGSVFPAYYYYKLILSSGSIAIKHKPSTDSRKRTWVVSGKVRSQNHTPRQSSSVLSFDSITNYATLNKPVNSASVS